MVFLNLLLATALSLLFLVLVFRPLEMAFPAKPGQKLLRPQWFLDLCFMAGQYLLWNGLVLWVLAQFSGVVGHVVPASFRDAVASQPFWLQAIQVVLLSDLFIYWGHRLQHNNAFLWRFHRVHHSSEHLDFLAAHREHPLDTVYTVGLINLPAFLLGFPIGTLVFLVAFRGVWAIYIHSNVRLPLKPIRWLVGAPELHHWHHDKARDAGNYANLSPIMDLLFGTYVCPDHEPASFGLHEPSPKTYVGHMVHPFHGISAILPMRQRRAPWNQWAANRPSPANESSLVAAHACEQLPTHAPELQPARSALGQPILVARDLFVQHEAVVRETRVGVVEVAAERA